MDSRKKIVDFASVGRRELNRGQTVRAVLWSALAFGAVALIAELAFVLRGHRVALPILILPLLLAGGVMAACYLRFRFSHHRAIRHMDRFFDLKEGLVTADEHLREGRNEEIHELQLNHTGRALEPLNPQQLRPGFPKRIFTLAGALFILSIVLLFVDDSRAVKEQQAEEAAVSALSEELADELEQMMEELREQDDPQTAELLEDPSLKRMIEEFQGSRDRKAVMRKLAEIDRRLTQMQSELDTRADENYLMELAEQLRKSRETEAIGDALAQRDYRQAAKELEAMQMNEQSGAQEQLALEKLAAQVGEAEKSMSQNESGSRRSAQEMSRQIQKMSEENKRNGECSNQTRNSMNESMQKNSNSMRQVAAKRQAQSALNQLGQQLQQCQNRMSGQGQRPGQGNSPGSQGEGENPGGLLAGEGVDRSRRPPGMSSPSEGQLDQLSGQLGEGESQKMIEDALSGTGSASGGGAERGTVDYKQQVEDFVRREDIPEEMKQGVKTYFKQIHEMSSDAPSEE
ncbi:MAG: hypothetical protein JXR25_09525 [Pontiellaceae bacterium]|nr:hypothetical protein [Pontiellaceae bacterium]MBN2785056.1 hypothetical protein [Pontiellaceae bacterium]